MGMFQSIGIFCLSVSGHSTLPALRSAMARPARFSIAVRSAFAILTVVYCTVAAIGYW